MAEGENGMAKGRTRKSCKRKQLLKESSVDDGSYSSPQLSDIESSSSKSYVIEWLCAHPYPATALPFLSPAEDPPSFHDIYHHNLEKVPSINSSRTSFMVNRRRPDSVAEMFCHTSRPRVEREQVPLCWQVPMYESAQPWSSPQPVSTKAPEGLDNPCAGLPNGLNNYAQTIHYCNCRPSGVCKPWRKGSSPVGHPAEKLANKPGRKENKAGYCEVHGNQANISLEDPTKPEHKTARKPAPEIAGASQPDESQLAKADMCSEGQNIGQQDLESPTHNPRPSTSEMEKKQMIWTVWPRL
eukprot:g29410.t1